VLRSHPKILQRCWSYGNTVGECAACSLPRVVVMTPQARPYLVVGGGVHGLSTAYHLARKLRATGRGDGRDVLVLDKEQPGAGASGIACGVIRNNYFQPAMRQLMAHSVSVWETHQEVLAYHPVGYLQAAHEPMAAGVAQIHAEQQAVGYPSTLVEGEAACRAYLRKLFPDWQARGITSVLHEHRGGFADAPAAVRGLAALAEADGVRIRPGVRVTGVELGGGAVTAVTTDHGRVGCEQLVVAAGPWTRDLWRMLDLPAAVTLPGPGGKPEQRPMWTYWLVQEGTLKVSPDTLTTAGGSPPPVVHVDTDAPLHDDTGALVTDQPWGIYYKPDRRFGGVQGGAMPARVEQPTDQVAVDPYGPARSRYVAGEDFRRLWAAGLAHCHARFQGTSHLLSQEPSGGIGCFTPDSFPVFDRFHGNAYVIADSNHGFKMLGVGALVAGELLDQPSGLLAPFSFSRFARGALHPVSASPFPWS
jgi:methylglutamate dehydrogenase subunit A